MPHKIVVCKFLSWRGFSNLVPILINESNHQSLLFMSTVVVLELFKTEASQINLCVAKCWAHCWNHFENKHILVISEGVLFISEMQCVVLTIVLAITRWSKHYSIWDAYCW